MTEHDDIARAIGATIRTRRAAAGLTRKQLAQTADVSERYLHNLETGAANVSIGILSRVAVALSSDLYEIVLAARSSDTAVAQIQAVETKSWRPLPALAALLGRLSVADQEVVIPHLERLLLERRRDNRGIALLGLRGAGKTTLGRRLAEKLGLPFVSITREIEARAGMSLADLFNLGGPAAYRGVENEVARELAAREDRIVLETAGGIVGNAEALGIILGAFTTVWLRASPEEHLTRVIQQGDMRPMRDNPGALEHLKSLLAEREAEYSRAEFVLETSGRSIEACLAELEQYGRRQPAAHAAG